MHTPLLSVLWVHGWAIPVLFPTLTASGASKTSHAVECRDKSDFKTGRRLVWRVDVHQKQVLLHLLRVLSGKGNQTCVCVPTKAVLNAEHDMIRVQVGSHILIVQYRSTENGTCRHYCMLPAYNFTSFLQALPTPVTMNCFW